MQLVCFITVIMVGGLWATQKVVRIYRGQCSLSAGCTMWYVCLPLILSRAMFELNSIYILLAAVYIDHMPMWFQHYIAVPHVVYQSRRLYIYMCWIGSEAGLTALLE